MLVGVVVLVVLLLPLLLQPAAAMATAAASTIALRLFSMLILIPPLLAVSPYCSMVTITFIASGGRLMANSNASAVRASVK